MKSALSEDGTRVGWMGILLLVILIAAVYGRAIGYDFINYDDPSYVYNNEVISQGVSLHGIKWALTQVGETNLWHPLTWMSHMLDVEVFGVDHPGGHHGVNVFWHLVASVGVFFLLRRMTGSLWLGLLLAALWAVHPHRVQSVMWVSERKDVLSGAFFVWSWWSWEKWKSEGEGHWAWYGLALVLFVLAGLSKPSVVPLPAILWVRELLRERAPLSLKSVLHGWKPLLPFVVVSIVVAGLTIYFQRIGGMADVTSVMPFSRRLMLMPVSLWWYVESFVAPFSGKLWVYPPAGHFTDWVVPGVGLGLLGIWYLWRGRKYRLVSLGLAVFFLMWMPVSGIVPVSFYFVADRYSYLMQLGLLIALSGVFLELWRWGDSMKDRRLLVGCALMLVLIAALVSWSRVGYWKNSETLFAHESAINPRSLLAPIQLGVVYEKQGRDEEALSLYRESCLIDKESGLARANAGLVLEKLGREKEAAEMYRAAMEAKNLHSEIAFLRLAKIQYKAGDYTRVEAILKRGLKRFPRRVSLMTDLGTLALSARNDPRQALMWYDKALEIDPFFADAMQGRGAVLLKLGRGQEAKAAIDLLIKHHPERAYVRKFLK